MSNAITGESQFSKAYINLQKSICCGGDGGDRILKWVGCTPGIYQGANTVFLSSDIGLCGWNMLIDSYAYQTFAMNPGDSYEVMVDADFVMLKAKWPTTDEITGCPIPESFKVLELGINQQAGMTGMTNPYPEEAPNPPSYMYMVVKDLYIMNTVAQSKFTIFKITNISTMPAIVSIFGTVSASGSTGLPGYTGGNGNGQGVTGQ